MTTHAPLWTGRAATWALLLPLLLSFSLSCRTGGQALDMSSSSSIRDSLDGEATGHSTLNLLSNLQCINAGVILRCAQPRTYVKTTIPQHKKQRKKQKRESDSLFSLGSFCTCPQLLQRTTRRQRDCKKDNNERDKLPRRHTPHNKHVARAALGYIWREENRKRSRRKRLEDGGPSVQTHCTTG